MIKITNKTKCCACTACVNICSKRAISMKEDEEGFLYPVVDLEKCVECGLCERVCPYLNKHRPRVDLEETYVGICKDENIRRQSSSGGMFSVFARKILEQRGLVYGAAYDEMWMVYHKGISDEKRLVELVGSKYLQSRLGSVYSNVKKNLVSGRIVLFVGTTCQIHGLKNFLMKEYENLITVDFICLGVPSPKIWGDYLDTFFDRKAITSINFKDKERGWHNFSLRINSEKQKFCKDGHHTYYFIGFFKHLYTRPSCANCVSKLGNRMSDITISDCWGYDMIAPEMDDNKGMSSIVCHTQKGLEFFSNCKEQILWKKGQFKDILEYNPGYRKSIEDSVLKEKFWRDYNKLSKKRLFRKYCTNKENKILDKVIRRFLYHMKER